MTNVDNSPVRVLLIDDHPAIRVGLGILLGTQGYHVCAEARDKADAMDVLERQEFDIALLDLSLQDGNGLELLPELELRGISTLVYTMHEEPEIIADALRSGALGYVSKQEDADILLAAIKTVIRGKRYLSPCAAQCLQAGGRRERGPEDTLSDREKQIFQLMGKGSGSTEIAEELGLSRRTVETYCIRMAKKMDFDDRSELRKYAISVC